MTEDPLTEAERAARKAKPIEINEVGREEATGEDLSASAVAQDDAPDSAAVPVVALQEELKATRSELQNTVEYLETVNSQLRHKIEELEGTTNDLNNLLAGSQTATLFLDDKFRIRWFTPAMNDLFELVSADIGHPIAHFAQKFSDKSLLRDAETVLKKLSTIDAEVLGDTGRWYVRRILPYRTQDNRNAGVVVSFTDITERKRAEALAERLSVIVEYSEDAIVSKDLDGIITSWNEGAVLLFGYSAEEVIGKSVTILIPPDHPDEEPGILARIRRGERIEHYETVRLRKDGSQIWVSLTVSPLKDAHGKIVGASKIARDMTERRRSDEHRKLLIGELNHRVKNTLAVVQSIASQSLGHASTMKEAREAFGARLINLAKAHDVLTRESWAGANLMDIVTDTVRPHAGGQSRFRIKGEHVRLKASTAVSIAMALHELATNAAKYGALADEEGHVDIVWHLDGEGDNRRLKLFWTESAGPPVTKPTRKGFGSRMIERALAAELDGNVNVTYEVSGVICTIDAPMPSGQKAGGHGDQ